ncbi:MAG: hypothetical protein GC179_11775 [Anaerolineaceae bacterium]|nr:hypothetical protein [Anaerolineaceae bacterium]
MSRYEEFIFEDGRRAYVSLVVAFIAVLLMWSIVFITSIELKTGNQVNFNLLILLSAFSKGFLLFGILSFLFIVAAFGLAIGSWKRFILVVILCGLIGFCGLTAFTSGAFGTSNLYESSTSILYHDHIFRIIHARRQGDMINEADYLLFECDVSGSYCKVINRFEDYRYDDRKSKSVSFFVNTSDNRLYLKVGDETILIGTT